MSEERVATLKREGYDKVYVWNAESNEKDPDHEHAFDTHLEVLDGEIEISVGATKTIMKTGNVLDIPRNTVHKGRLALMAANISLLNVTSSCLYPIRYTLYPIQYRHAPTDRDRGAASGCWPVSPR